MLFYVPGIKQTAKLVNSTLMELIIGVKDITDDLKESTEVIQCIKMDVYYILNCNVVI